MGIPKKFKFDTGVDCSISFVFFEVASECPTPSVFFRKELMHRVGDGTRLFLLNRYMGRFDTNDPSKGGCCENPIDDEFTDFAMELHCYEKDGPCDLSYCNDDSGENPCLLRNSDGMTIDQFDTWFTWGGDRISCKVERIYASDIVGIKLEAIKEHFPDLFEEIKPTMVPLIEKQSYGDEITLKSNKLIVKEHRIEKDTRVYFQVKPSTGGSPFLIYINKESNKLYLGTDLLDIIDNVERELFHWLHECFDFETGKATDFFDEKINQEGWA